MKKILYIALFAVLGLSMYSCDDGESYADQRDRELASISSFIANPTCGEIKGKPIKVISEEEFLKDTITDLAANEFVKFNSTGIYMQIVNRGCGKAVKPGESATVISRFTEYNVISGNLSWSNQYLAPEGYVDFYDKYNVYNSSGTFSGTFCQREDESSVYQSWMYNRTDATSQGIMPTLTVPRGWLEPFSYIRVGRPANGDEDIARVRLIVPHEHGCSYASNNVYPFYYEISYARGI